MHVHGSVNFGYKPIGADISPGSLSEPVKYRNINAAHSSVVSISTSGTRVEGEIYDAGVIISGSGKAGKIAYNTRPYGYYHRAAAEFFSKASQLLVMGYSWRDEHINTWVDEMIALRPERRTAIVTKRTGKDVGDNTALEYRKLSKLAGPITWHWLDGKAYQDTGDPSQRGFFQKDNFAIAPAGFILGDDVETDLLSFILQ